MPNYQLGKIYKIVSSQTDEIYIGSTCESRLCRRLAQHNADYRMWLRNAHAYYASYKLLKYDDCQIVLIENYPCNNKDELRMREQYWIDHQIVAIKFRHFVRRNKRKNIRKNKETQITNKSKYKKLS